MFLWSGSLSPNSNEVYLSFTFVGGKVDVHRDKVTCPRSHSRLMVGPGPKARTFDSQLRFPSALPHSGLLMPGSLCLMKDKTNHTSKILPVL